MMSPLPLPCRGVSVTASWHTFDLLPAPFPHTPLTQAPFTKDPASATPISPHPSLSSRGGGAAREQGRRVPSCSNSHTLQAHSLSGTAAAANRCVDDCPSRPATVRGGRLSSTGCSETAVCCCRDHVLEGECPQRRDRGYPSLQLNFLYAGRLLVQHFCAPFPRITISPVTHHCGLPSQFHHLPRQPSPQRLSPHHSPSPASLLTVSAYRPSTAQANKQDLLLSSSGRLADE